MAQPISVSITRGNATSKPSPSKLKHSSTKSVVYSGFRYQIIDVKKMPLGSVTKICFCGDHDDLTRLQIQLYEALGERAHLCFSATDCLEVLPVGSQGLHASRAHAPHQDARMGQARWPFLPQPTPAAQNAIRCRYRQISWYRDTGFPDDHRDAAVSSGGKR